MYIWRHISSDSDLKEGQTRPPPLVLAGLVYSRALEFPLKAYLRALELPLKVYLRALVLETVIKCYTLPLALVGLDCSRALVTVTLVKKGYSRPECWSA